MVTLEAIHVRIEKLQAQAHALRERESTKALETIRHLMSKYGLTTADVDAHIGDTKRDPKTRTKAVVKAASTTAKYRDPKSGATWSGRGPAPAWLAAAKDRSKFLNDPAGAAAAGVADGSKTKPATRNARVANADATVARKVSSLRKRAHREAKGRS